MIGFHSGLRENYRSRLKAESDMEAAWLKKDMEDDEAYQESRDLNMMDSQPFYDEHSDSAYQAGKDRDDH